MSDDTANMDIGTFPADRKTTRDGANKTDGFCEQSPKRESRFDLVVKAGHEGFHGGNSATLGMLAADVTDESRSDAKENTRESVQEVGWKGGRRIVCKSFTQSNYVVD